jgi:hypothetical protein
MRIKDVDDSDDKSWKENVTSKVEDNVTPEQDAREMIDYFNKTIYGNRDKRREFISLVVRE